MEINYIAVRLLRIANKLSIKFHCGRSIGNLLFRIFNTKGEKTYNKGDAKTYLSSIHKDVESSSICENKIVEPTVDLQIIVPIYNVEKYLDSCLQSILNQQTNYTFKIVAINDGSPDKCGEILKNYQNDDRIIIYTQNNEGHSSARNTGLKTIFGRYIGFVDSDDMLAPNAIQNWLDYAYKTDADIVDGSYRRMTAKGKLQGGFVHTSQSSKSGFIWTRIYKPYLFQNIHFPEKYWFEDSVIGLILANAHKYVSITDYVYYYRTNPNSITHNFRRNVKSIDSLYITQSLLKDASQLSYFDFNADSSINFFLGMFQHNWHRTYIHGKDVEYAVYTIAKNLLTQYFPNKHTTKKELQELETALRTDNFYVYRRECCYM